MTIEENTKTLYGNVELNDYYYLWHSEPGACEKCRSMDGKTFDDANTIPDKPHPNCKCWIERKKYPSSDPIEYHRDKIQEQKNLGLEFEKLKGDLRCLEDECDANINLINKEIKTIEQVEYTVNSEYLKPLNIDIKNAKKDLINSKKELRSNINEIENQLSEMQNISEIKNAQLNYYDKIYFQTKITVEEYFANDADKKLVDNLAKIYAKHYNLNESLELYKVASKNYNFNKPYVNKNGVMYNKIEELNSTDIEQYIHKRLSEEKTGMNNCKVLLLNYDSSISNLILHDKKFLEFLKNNINNIRKNKNIPETKIEFEEGDLYNSLHGALIKGIHLQDDGTLILRIEDLYNFNEKRTSVRGRLGRRLQLEGHIIPYYIIILVKIPNAM